MDHAPLFGVRTCTLPPDGSARVSEEPQTHRPPNRTPPRRACDWLPTSSVILPSSWASHLLLPRSCQYSLPRLSGSSPSPLPSLHLSPPSSPAHPPLQSRRPTALTSQVPEPAGLLGASTQRLKPCATCIPHPTAYAHLHLHPKSAEDPSCPSVWAAPSFP